MEDPAVGRVFREVRRRLGISQSELADRANVCQATVSRIERGHLGSIAVARIRSVAGALEIRMPFAPSWRGSELARLLDARHASLVSLVVAMLGAVGWETAVEVTFSEYGERGSIDVLAWHAQRQALVVIEIKSRIVDLQDLLAGMDRKARLASRIASRSRGWDPALVGVVLVLPAGSTTALAIARHEPVFRVSLPARTIAVKRWLRRPDGPLRGILIVRDSHPTTGSRRARARVSGG